MLKSDLYGALSRGYCSKKNSSKVVDVDLIESMANEIMCILENKTTLERSKFQQELECLINKHCCENESDTPDWVLAEYLQRCLTAFNACVDMRERWYGRVMGKNICQEKIEEVKRLNKISEDIKKTYEENGLRKQTNEQPANQNKGGIR